MVAFIEEPKNEQPPQHLWSARQGAGELSAWCLFPCYILIPCWYFPLAESDQRWREGRELVHCIPDKPHQTKAEWRKCQGRTGFFSLYARLRQDFSTLAILAFWPAESLCANCPVHCRRSSSIPGPLSARWLQCPLPHLTAIKKCFETLPSVLWGSDSVKPLGWWTRSRFVTSRMTVHSFTQGKMCCFIFWLNCWQPWRWTLESQTKRHNLAFWKLTAL